MEKKKKLYGTFQTNAALPIHSWYPYLAGFSAEFVEREIRHYSLDHNNLILDPFLGVGTTSVVAKGLNINSIGIEVNPFIAFVAKTKLFWDIDKSEVKKESHRVMSRLRSPKFKNASKRYPKIIHRAFSPKILEKLCNLKESIKEIDDENIRNLCMLALVRTLKPVSNCKNFAPYFQLRDTRLKDAPVNTFYEKTLYSMLNDLEKVPVVNAFSDVYEGDARDLSFIDDESVSCVITSPPYLNNWDYSYITRLELYFFDFYDSIEDISKNLKKKLVKSSGFVLNGLKEASLPQVRDQQLKQELLSLKQKLSKNSEGRVLKYDIMTAAYLSDMHRVLKELHRVLEPNGKISLVVGDSSLYGVHVPTDILIAKMGEDIGYRTHLEILRERRATQHKKQLVETNIRFVK